MLEIAMINRRESGFTMIELMITIAIAAILMIMAIPNFTDLMRRNAVANESNRFLTALQLARTKAISGSFRSGVCPGSGTACGGSDNAYAEDGYSVFTMAGAAEAKVLLISEGKASTNKIKVLAAGDSKKEISFNRLGKLNGPVTKAIVCFDGQSTERIPGVTINISVSGRIQSEKMIPGASCTP
jgi:type IV fimbrial biogenesis protein FimT